MGDHLAFGWSAFSNGQITAADDSPVRVTVKVPTIAKGKGQLLLAVFANEEDFPGKPEKASLRFAQQIQQNQRAAVFNLQLPKGKYALALVHDVNGNGKIDTNLFGIPTEPYGFSNNPKIRFGPPSFQESAVAVSQAMQLDIVLK